jgi:hypothetical protein
MGHWVRSYLPNCSGDGRWSCSTKVIPRMAIHFHPLDAKPLTTLEQASKLSAHKSGGQSWGSMEQNDYLLFNHLPLSLQYMSNFVKDWRSFQRRWVTLGWWLTGIAPSGTRGPQKVLGSNPIMCQVKHLLALWQWAWLDLGLSAACQVGCASKNKSKKGFGLSMLKACSDMSKVKGCVF